MSLRILSLATRHLSLAAAILGGCAGCTSTTYVDPATGARFSRISVGTTQSIGEIRVETEGARRALVVTGYTNEQAQVAAAAVEAAVRAAGVAR